MRPRTLLILAVAIIFLIAGFFYWLGSYVTSKKLARFKKIVVVEAPKARKAIAPPSIPKKFKNPKVAIVIDDFGYNMNNVDALLNISEPVTLSILPDLRYSAEIAGLARLRGREAILHLPLEPHRKDVKEEVDTIKSGMSEKEIVIRLAKAISSVPGLSGVSNHMGSKSTEEKDLMTTILKHLKKNNLYFFDSLTSEKSVCREAASLTGVKYARRDMFLDNTNSVEYIEKQLLDLEKLAFKRGRAIAICHDRKNTMIVLARKMPEMAKGGIKFVSLSNMVR